MSNHTDRTPLLQDHARNFWVFNDSSHDNYHQQFCKLVGIPPSDLSADDAKAPVPAKSLYGRALKGKRQQQTTYALTAAVSNTLLLSQVVLGAAVTALGASASSHILITLFGALNTIIAGVVAYLKSRGQPMRARAFRDDLERVVDEIENSEIMWRDKMKTGISKKMHGYEEIDIDNSVTVRGELARLTRLYERAVRTNTANSPDMYQGGDVSLMNAGVNLKPVDTAPAADPSPAAAAAAAITPVPSSAPVVQKLPPDASPATAPVLPKDPKKAEAAATAGPSGTVPPAKDPKPVGPPKDPDASPVTTDPKGKNAMTK